MTERDTQRGKVWKLVADKGTPLGAIEAFNFASQITRSRWWGEREPRYRSVRLLSSTHPCVPTVSRILDALQISDKCRSDLKVIETLAHWLAYKENPELQPWHHGPAFALIFLNMVKRFAPDKYDDIRNEYKLRRIKRKTVSDDARLNAQARHAKAQLQRMIGELTSE